MQAHCPDQTLPVLTPSHPDTDQHEAGHLVYQATTVLAISALPDQLLVLLAV